MANKLYVTFDLCLVYMLFYRWLKKKKPQIVSTGISFGKFVLRQEQKDSSLSISPQKRYN